MSYYSLNDLDDMKKIATDLHRRTQTQDFICHNLPQFFLCISVYSVGSFLIGGFL